MRGRYSWPWIVTAAAFIVHAGCSAHRTPVPPAAATADRVATIGPAETTGLHGVSIEPLAKARRWGFLFFWDYQADPPTAEQVRVRLPLVISELKRYPADLFERLRLKRIVLCGSIRINGEETGGFAWADREAIYLGVREWDRAYWPDYLATSVLHELFHIIDARDGSAGDAEWKGLNPKGFHYGRGTSQEMALCADRREGFLDAYSGRNIGEDKAQIFSHLMTHYAAVRDLGGRDPIIGAKADLMEKMVADFSPAMDAAFWAEARRRSESAEDRFATSMRYGWLKLQPGVDPLEPNRDPTEPFAVVRRTRFQNYQGFAQGKGRETHLGIAWEDLVRFLYGLNDQKFSAPRCVAPEDLKTSRFDLIVALPDAELYDPRIWKSARAAFEAGFGVTMRKEMREVDVYVLRVGPGGTERLEAAARRAERESQATKRKHFWSNLLRLRSTGSAWEMKMGVDLKNGKMRYAFHNAPLTWGLSNLEQVGVDRPLIDETDFQKPLSVAVPYASEKCGTLKALATALGLEVVPARRAIEMTVLEKSEPTSQPAVSTVRSSRD